MMPLDLMVSIVAESVKPLDIRARIVALEQSSQAAVDQYPESDGRPLMPVTHRFTDGLYIREIFIPKGLFVVGKIHRHEHLNFISRGKVTMVTEFDGLRRLEGPCTLISKAGTKRALYTHEDTVWTTVHVTRETDLEKLEHEIIAPSYAAIGLWDPAMTMLTEV